MGISWQELVVVLLIVLVLFGPKRLPEVGSSLGRGIRGFKDSLNGRDVSETRATVSTGSDAAAVPVAVEVVEPQSTTADSQR